MLSAVASAIVRIRIASDSALAKAPIRTRSASARACAICVASSSDVLCTANASCFFASAYIYTDRIAPADVRHSAQTVFGIIILGGGPVLGGLLSGWLADTYARTAGVVDYGALWRVVSLIGLAATVLFWIGFRERKAPAESGM